MHYISDHRLKCMLQDFLETEEFSNEKTKNVKKCATGIFKIPCVNNRMYIMRDIDNPKKVRLTGALTCSSSWSCPTCTPIRMAQIGSDIECLIKALNKQGLDAYMITFSALNVRQFKCDEIFNFQAIAWRDFYKARKTNKTYTIKSGENRGKTVKYNIKLTPWVAFTEIFEIDHFVRVYDFTWSDKHSWHPHVHALFFIPQQYRRKFADSFELIERELQENWMHHLKNAARKYLTKKYKDNPERLNELIKLTDTLYNMDDFEDKTVNSKPVWISRNKKTGKPRFIANARYVTGWSFNKELTCQRKQGHEDKQGDKHYTPHEMLQLAYDRKDKRRYILQKYVEFMVAVHGRKRTTISKGDKKIIEEYKLTEDYMISIKKNIMEVGKQETVVWFNELQWSEISCLKFRYPQIVTQILKRARFSDKQKARDTICAFLLHYNLDISRNNFDDKQAQKFTRNHNKLREMYFESKLQAVA